MYTVVGEGTKMIFMDVVTLEMILLVTLTTATSDALWHIVYPPFGKDRVIPANEKLSRLLWGYNSLHLGATFQIAILWILNPVTTPIYVWVAEMVQTLIFMMILHQIVVIIIRSVLIYLKYAEHFPEDYLHNFWTFYGFNIHVDKNGVILYNALAVILFLVLEATLR